MKALDAASGAAVGEPLRGHEVEVWSAAVDGTRVLSGGSDGFVHVSDAVWSTEAAERLGNDGVTVFSATVSTD
jgi:hypothetical protein